MSSEPTYTFKKDYSEPLSDGTGEKVLFRAGQVVAWETAKQLGLVKGDPPEEKKVEQEKQTK